DARIAHVVEPGRVRRDQVIVVDAVLDQELPVRLDVVLLHARDDLHAAGRRLVDPQTDVLLGAREITEQVDRVAIEVEEPEVAVTFEPRHRDEAHLRLVEARRIGLLARHVAQRTVQLIGPAVIHAVEIARIAFALAAHHGAAVAARVDQAADRAVAVAAEDDRPAGRPAGAEIARVLELRRMADIDPATVEQRALLALEDVTRHEHLALDLERHGLAVLDHHGVAVFVSLAVILAMSVGTIAHRSAPPERAPISRSYTAALDAVHRARLAPGGAIYRPTQDAGAAHAAQLEIRRHRRRARRGARRAGPHCRTGIGGRHDRRIERLAILHRG